MGYVEIGCCPLAAAKPVVWILSALTVVVDCCGRPVVDGSAPGVSPLHGIVLRKRLLYLGLERMVVGIGVGEKSGDIGVILWQDRPPGLRVGFGGPWPKDGGGQIHR